MRSHRQKTVVCRKRWLSYATAAGAGLFSSLCPVDSADSDTIVRDVNVFMKDENVDGYFTRFGPFSASTGANFSFLQAYSENNQPQAGILAVTGNIVSFAGWQVGLNYFFASNVPYGHFISNLDFDVAPGNMGVMAWSGINGRSQFRNPGIGYLAFRFDVGEGTQYGWAMVEMDGAPQNTGTFIRYAWEEAGVPLRVGHVNFAIPEPHSLGMLALGGAALLAWRRSKSRADRNP